MKTYRIVKLEYYKNDTFIVQKKCWFFWKTVKQYLNYGFYFDRQFDSIDKAKSYIYDVQPPKKTVIETIRR